MTCTLVYLGSAIFSFLAAAAWPLAIFSIAIVFRAPINEALKRLKTVGREGVEFAQLQQQVTPTNDAARAIALPPDLGEDVDRMLRQGIEAFERDVRTAVATQRPPVTAEQAPSFIGGLYLFRWHMDRIYWAIFGSQLELLQHLVVHQGSATLSQAEEIWHRAKGAFFEIHENRTFEQWLGYLLGSQLIVTDERGVHISGDGRGLISYVSQLGYSLNKPG